ncbi:MAG: cache domain-containing protein [Pseudomonadota bacterium]
MIRTIDGQGLKVRIIAGYTSIFIAASILGGMIIYSQVKSTITRNIRNELKNSTDAVLNMVRTAANVSIKNYLRAVCEKTRENIEDSYYRYESGQITEEQAKIEARRIMFSQTIGRTGYIYCVSSNGIPVEHKNPDIAAKKDWAENGFVKEMIKRKEGYLEYDWKNPGETVYRPKALYMSYFKPWDWIISVATYTEELKELINVNDFKESVLALKFGKTGYSYITDSKGTLIVHPLLTGNYFDFQDGEKNYFVREMTRLKTGQLVYSWKNPEDETFRKKIVIFNYIPEYDWIVASSGYFDEFYSILDIVRHIIIVSVVIMLFLLLLTSLWLSKRITQPLEALMNHFDMGVPDNLSTRMPVTSNDEIGRLSTYFNRFMDKLEAYNQNLRKEISEHKLTAEALVLSEEMFSKAFQCSPSGMFLAHVDNGKLININDSFLKLTGYDATMVMGKTLMELDFFGNPIAGGKLLRQFNKTMSLRNQDIKFCRRTGEARQGIISAEVLEIGGKKCILAALEDLTEVRKLEREFLDMGERERRKIAFALHDDLCPQLIGIDVLMEILRQKLKKTQPDMAAYADRIGVQLQESIMKTRLLSRGLCPVDIVKQGFDASLSELAGYVKDMFGITCFLECDDSNPFTDDTAASHAYYIAHEAVHNAVKHAGADSISIRFSTRRGRSVLVVEDDGKGFARDVPHKGMGLKIMQYRARRINGTLDIRGRDGGGTVVRLEMEHPVGNGDQG